GKPLQGEFRKAFRTGSPDEQCPDPKAWQVQAPAPGTAAPLTVTFPKPLDHALLHRVIQVTDAQGQAVAGKVTVRDEETRGQFTPENPWRPGASQRQAGTALEDLAGNNVARPFGVDVSPPVQSKVTAETVRLPFQVGRVP